jgi:hypothetical protein
MLRELGETPDQVANVFRVLGIKGVRNTVRFLNPVVRYTHCLVKNALGIDIILGDRLRIYVPEGSSREVEVPTAVVQFLERFHRGEYPDLELDVGPDGVVDAYPISMTGSVGSRKSSIESHLDRQSPQRA